MQLFSGDTHYDLEDYHYNREDYHRKQPAAIRRPDTTKERRSKTHSLTDTLNLLLQVTQGFIVNGSSEKFSE